MAAITFSIPGTPRGKGRPRSFRRGNFIGHYTDAQTQNYEAQVATFCQQAMVGRQPLQGPVKLTVDAMFTVPTSWSKKRKATALWHTSKPDLSNIVKACEDGCNGIAWRDDAQVAITDGSKTYRAVAGVMVTVEGIGVDGEQGEG